MPWSMPKVRIVANACITRYYNGEAQDLKTLLDSYTAIADEDRQAVTAYVAQQQPTIPYEASEASTE